MTETILVTGAAGFIGAFLSKRLLERGSDMVIGFDNLNDYYDVRLKHDRLQMLHEAAGQSGRFEFIRGDLADAEAMNAVFNEHRPTVVVNLAAQAGVRYSIDNPRVYVDSNLNGFFNLLEACRHNPVKHLVYASSSSVYGMNRKVPYSTSDPVDNPVSLYAATKKSNELMAHAYSSLYTIPTTGLRFFTVYGPMGRPDMAYFKFTNRILRGEPIEIYNMGDMLRDFTYIDDIVSGIINVIQKSPSGTPDAPPYKLYNIGNSRPESLLFFVETLERILLEEDVISKPTEHRLLPMQPGDVYQTYADVDDLVRDFGFKPTTTLEDGLRQFARWYLRYYPRTVLKSSLAT